MSQQIYSNNMSMDEVADDYKFSAALEDDNEADSNDDRKASGTNPNYNNFNPNFYNPFEIKHRRRTSHGQFKILEQAFVDNPKPNGKIRQELAESLSMSPRGVQVWFQNRRAKAKQQEQQQIQKQKQKQRKQQLARIQDYLSTASAVDDLEISINDSRYTPIILSASNMVHSRSQSSSSSSAYTCSDSLRNSLSYSSSMEESSTEKMVESPHVNQFPSNAPSKSYVPQPQSWHSESSIITGEDEDDIRMTESPFTPHVQSQVHVNSPEQNIWLMESDSMASLICHQTLLNQQTASTNAAAIGDDNAALLKTDLFTINNNNSGDTMGAWTYVDAIQSNYDQGQCYGPMSQAALLEGVIGHANSEQSATRLLGNEMAYNRNVDDWIRTVSLMRQQGSGIQDHIILNQILGNGSVIEKDEGSRRRSYPPIPLQQDEAYWAGHQIMRRLSEPTHNSSELELVHSYLHNYNNYSATIM